MISIYKLCAVFIVSTATLLAHGGFDKPLRLSDDCALAIIDECIEKYASEFPDEKPWEDERILDAARNTGYCVPRNSAIVIHWWYLPQCKKDLERHMLQRKKGGENGD